MKGIFDAVLNGAETLLSKNELAELDAILSGNFSGKPEHVAVSKEIADAEAALTDALVRIHREKPLIHEKREAVRAVRAKIAAASAKAGNDGMAAWEASAYHPDVRRVLNIADEAERDIGAAEAMIAPLQELIASLNSQRVALESELKRDARLTARTAYLAAANRLADALKAAATLNTELRRVADLPAISGVLYPWPELDRRNSRLEHWLRELERYEVES